MSQSTADTTSTPSNNTPGRSGNKSDRKPPYHRTLSLLGSASEIQRDALGFLLKTQQAGEVVRLRFLFSPAYLISHPESIKHVLQYNARNYNKDIISYTMFRPLLGKGLLINDGPSWLHQRRLMQPAFHRKRLATYATQMTEATDEMLERWKPRFEQETPLNIAEEMMRLTLRIVGQALFSLDLDQETSTIGPAVTTVLELLGDYVLRPIPPLSVPTPRNRRLRRAIQAIDQVVYRLISERRASQTEGSDLLSMLLLARDEETGEGMSDQQVRDEVMTILLAGHETTANTLTWTWYLLSQSPEVERRLHTELNEVLAGRVPTVEDLPNLKYTRMVIEETLRLYPPTPVLSRKAISDDELLGYPVAANSMIMISPYAIHRNPALWEKPQQFDPERFSPERVAARPAYAYLPFGGGPRVCIGNNFALMEAQLILSTIAQRYRLRLIPNHPVEPQMVVTLRPRYGMPMTLHSL